MSTSSSSSNNPFYAMLGRTYSVNSEQTLDSLRTSSFRSSSASTQQQDGDVREYLWTPPAPDPNYWINVAKARNIRQSILKLRDYLNRVLQTPVSAQRTEDYQRVTTEIRARERKLMKYVNHYILSFDDVLLSEQQYQEQQQQQSRHQKHVQNRSMELGTISPPMSPGNSTVGKAQQPPQQKLVNGISAMHAANQKGLSNKRLANINIEVPPRFASGSLPPTPTTSDTPKESSSPGSLAAADYSPSPSPLQHPSPSLGSQAFINSYKQNVRYQNAGSNASSLTNSSADLRKEKSKSKLIWGGLFGSKNVRSATDDSDAQAMSAFANATGGHQQQKQQQAQLTKMASSPSLAQMRASRKLSEPQKSIFAL
ncbi:hypothetical protein GGF40_000776 [Coemansia sp. RSA 1286]|nr:hypothetical protein IWW45_005380 [Coemansia sp. RSA 485]KAJ2603145.1 hypothetical protein GGF39_000283 [Coemansia sp. RSA 1721]KAJ2639534.1 hypothetical protein GGF40_000776 [Coemansia sp. RSA 1286]